MGKAKILIIDADSFAYRLGPNTVTDNFYSSFEADESCEDEESFKGEGFTDTIMEDLGNGNIVETSLALAEETVGVFIEDLLKSTGHTRYQLYVSPGSLYDKAVCIHEGLEYDKESVKGDSTNFRYKIADDLAHGYKHNRTSLAPPAGVIAIMYSMVYHYDAILAVNCEADDIVCALGRQEHVTVAALDKDVINQTAGRVWNYGAGTWVETTPEYANFYKYWQAICGDPGDGYKGVPGVGPKAAEKLIKPGMTDLELFTATLQCYESKGLGMTECLATLRLADMHQLTFINEENYVVEVYQPPEGFEL